MKLFENICYNMENVNIIIFQLNLWLINDVNYEIFFEFFFFIRNCASLFNFDVLAQSNEIFNSFNFLKTINNTIDYLYHDLNINIKNIDVFIYTLIILLTNEIKFNRYKSFSN